MLQSSLKGHFSRAGLGRVLGLVVLAACAGGTARAQAQDGSNSNSIWNLDQRIMGSIARSLGLRDPNDPGIEYRERSPLVVPPTRELPPPQANATPRNPAWPVDPDVKRARDRAKAKGKLATIPGYPRDDGRPLTPSELDPVGAPTTTGTTASTASGPPRQTPDDALRPSQLGYFGGLFSLRAFGFGRQRVEVGTFTGEPPRTDLTAPPTGYQTPSPAQPYGTTGRPVDRGPERPRDPEQDFKP